MRLPTFLVLLVISVGAWQAAHAQAHEYDDRWYAAALYSETFADSSRLSGDGHGGILAIGKRTHPNVAFELYALGTSYSVDGGSAEIYGIAAGLDYFPFASRKNLSSGLFVLLGAGYGDGDSDVTTATHSDQERFIFDVGLGYVHTLFSRLAIRADVRYRYDQVRNPYGYFNGPASTDSSGFEEPVASIGLQVPFGSLPKAPPPPPVQVVAPLPVCGDGVDNDGDGRVDFPTDPGCASASDDDEADPSACSDGLDNDGDGKIDFPADKGCMAADDDDETDPCKMPEPGERLSLDGCGTGDVLELEGVNFEFDKDKLTPNAKTLLDQVAAELNDHPGIDIEIGGHTDSLGSDSYNQRLSASRAAAVMAYLGESGVESSRMSSKGYGEDVPIDTNETEDGRERNRRVELKIVGGTAGATGSEATPYEDRDSMRPSSEAAKPENESSADKSASESPPSTDEDDSSDDLDFLDF